MVGPFNQKGSDLKSVLLTQIDHAPQGINARLTEIFTTYSNELDQWCDCIRRVHEMSVVEHSNPHHFFENQQWNHILNHCWYWILHPDEWDTLKTMLEKHQHKIRQWEARLSRTSGELKDTIQEILSAQTDDFETLEGLRQSIKAFKTNLSIRSNQDCFNFLEKLKIQRHAVRTPVAETYQDALRSLYEHSSKNIHTDSSLDADLLRWLNKAKKDAFSRWNTQEIHVLFYGFEQMMKHSDDDDFYLRLSQELTKLQHDIQRDSTQLKQCSNLYFREFEDVFRWHDLLLPSMYEHQLKHEQRVLNELLAQLDRLLSSWRTSNDTRS